ncbi:YpbS family protein [Paenibacillus agricola]|uniref:YpbS family protein n=1 Tax=Paenibacillus agricola TaxID=2716264 RepID=A0ABX0J2L2_9BACL|nr:YpbS family protein [Paenibacillus agricola]NHN30560.1 YpbS family protein [Paenibacillus agricola]
MSVHQAITSHTLKMHAHLDAFLLLDQQRELAIDQAIALCAAGEPFSLEGVNVITARINEHAKQGISPTRPHVTKEMVTEYVQRKAAK